MGKNLDSLLVGLLPLVLFVIIDIYQDSKKGIYAAIGLSFLIVIYCYIKTQYWDWLIFGEFLLLFFMGFISLRLNDSKYFKLQPAVLAAVFALVFTVFQLMGRPLLIELIPHLVQLNPRFSQIYENAQTMALLSRISHGIIYLFIIHGSATAYAAIFWSSKVWLGVRLAFYPGMIILWLLVANL